MEEGAVALGRVRYLENELERLQKTLCGLTEENAELKAKIDSIGGHRSIDVNNDPTQNNKDIMDLEEVLNMPPTKEIVRKLVDEAQQLRALVRSLRERLGAQEHQLMTLASQLRNFNPNVSLDFVNRQGTLEPDLMSPATSGAMNVCFQSPESRFNKQSGSLILPHEQPGSENKIAMIRPKIPRLDIGHTPAHQHRPPQLPAHSLPVPPQSSKQSAKSPDSALLVGEIVQTATDVASQTGLSRNVSELSVPSLGSNAVVENASIGDGGACEAGPLLIRSFDSNRSSSLCSQQETPKAVYGLNYQAVAVVDNVPQQKFTNSILHRDHDIAAPDAVAVIENVRENNDLNIPDDAAPVRHSDRSEALQDIPLGEDAQLPLPNNIALVDQSSTCLEPQPPVPLSKHDCSQMVCRDGGSYSYSMVMSPGRLPPLSSHGSTYGQLMSPANSYIETEDEETHRQDDEVPDNESKEEPILSDQSYTKPPSLSDLPPDRRISESAKMVSPPSKSLSPSDSQGRMSGGTLNSLARVTPGIPGQETGRTVGTPAASEKTVRDGTPTAETDRVIGTPEQKGWGTPIPKSMTFHETMIGKQSMEKLREKIKGTPIPENSVVSGSISTFDEDITKGRDPPILEGMSQSNLVNQVTSNISSVSPARPPEVGPGGPPRLMEVIPRDTGGKAGTASVSASLARHSESIPEGIPRPVDVKARDTGAARPTEVTAGEIGTARPTEVTAREAGTARPTEVTARETGTARPVEVTARETGTARPIEATAREAGTARPIEVTAREAGTARPIDITAREADTARPIEVTAREADTARPIEVTARETDTARPIEVTARETARDITARDITARDTTARDITSRDITARDVTAREATAGGTIQEEPILEEAADLEDEAVTAREKSDDSLGDTPQARHGPHGGDTPSKLSSSRDNNRPSRPKLQPPGGPRIRRISEGDASDAIKTLLQNHPIPKPRAPPSSPFHSAAPVSPKSPAYNTPKSGYGTPRRNEDKLAAITPPKFKLNNLGPLDSRRGPDTPLSSAHSISKGLVAKFVANIESKAAAYNSARLSSPGKNSVRSDSNGPTACDSARRDSIVRQRIAKWQQRLLSQKSMGQS